MKEVIERMLKVEEEARAILAEAQKRAADVLEAGRKHAGVAAEKLRSEARAEAARQVEDARRTLDKQRQEELARTVEAAGEYTKRARTNFAAAVDLVVRRVVGG
jgi:F0F1-type ATP synthase membrane subunit b/b'